MRFPLLEYNRWCIKNGNRNAAILTQYDNEVIVIDGDRITIQQWVGSSLHMRPIYKSQVEVYHWIIKYSKYQIVEQRDKKLNDLGI